MNISEYNGVWVFAEQRNGELQKVSLEILGEGRKGNEETPRYLSQKSEGRWVKEPNKIILIWTRQYGLQG